LTRVEFAKQNKHYYIPVLISSQGSATPTWAFVDTGSTKCMVPISFNSSQLRLRVVGHDKNVGIADGSRDIDYVVVPKIAIAIPRLEFGPANPLIVFDETDLQETNVETWLGDMFVMGMNFLSKFDVTLTRKGHIVIER